MYRIALALLFALPLSATAQDPPKPASIDQLIERLQDLRAKRGDLDKQEAATVAELRARMKELQDKLARLGLVDPPTPVPPAPPKPPAPVDPLAQKLQGAYKAAVGDDAQKVEWAKDLAALYRAAARTAADPNVATAGALKTKLATAAATLIGPDALKEVRQVVAGELAAVLPTAEQDLTADQRAAAAALFAKLAALLEVIAQ